MKNTSLSRWLWMAALGGSLLLQSCARENPEGGAPAPPPVPVKALTVRAAPLPQYYEAPGAVRSRRIAALASKLQATVVAVPVRLGDAVQAGQLLVELDPAETDAELRRAQAALEAAASGRLQAEKGLAAAQAEAQLAAATFARYQQLLEKNSVSRQEFDQAEARHKSAQAHLEIARAAVEQVAAQQAAATAALEAARIRQGYTRLTAPFAGYVASTSVDAGSSVGPGTPLLLLEDSREYQLEVALPESQSPGVRVGSPVLVSIPSIAMEVSGRVAEMQPGAEAGSRSVLVRVGLPANPRLRGGLFGRARFHVGEARGLSLPEALILRQGELRYVYVIAEGKARKRLVTVGSGSGGMAEVLSGLSEGEQVAASALDSLSDGAPVEIQP
ncbi:MAG TPA: efflux RND transporter periplasmic adaptor subunit [Terriglobia bacterium]|nr:efflux RND transporter periplasmic adaptor subunit [Terriglobia bacterium]